MLERLTQDAFFFFATIDPFGNLILFAALTAGLSATERNRMARRAVLYSTAILIISIVAGQVLLSFLSIRLLSLQVAGGIILFLLGLEMLFSGFDKTSVGKAEEGHDLAIFPLAVPAIAGPGAIMAVIVRTDSSVHSTAEQIATAAVLLAMLGVTWVLLLLAAPVLRLIGETGARILVRIFGMLLAALSVELVLTALSVPGWTP